MKGSNMLGEIICIGYLIIGMSFNALSLKGQEMLKDYSMSKTRIFFYSLFWPFTLLMAAIGYLQKNG